MSSSGLIIRGNERHEISLPVRVRISPSQADAVKFRRGMTQDNGWFDAHMIDFSSAGAGMMCTAFLPKGVRLEIEIPSLAEDEDTPLFTGEVRVMRVQMTDRRPAYLVGTSFVDSNPDETKDVMRIIAMLNGEDIDDA